MALNVKIDFEKATNEILMGLDRGDKKVQKSIREAVTRTSKYFYSQVLKAMSLELKVQMKKLTAGKRVTMRFSRKGKENLAVLWLGLNPLVSAYWDNIKSDSSGAYIKYKGQNIHHFPRGFIAPGKNSGKPLIFERTGNKVELAEIPYPQNTKSIIGRIQRNLNKKFRQYLEQRLEYNFSRIK